MSSTLLVDSSAWIAHYRDQLDPQLAKTFDQALQDGRVTLVPPVWLELVVGFRSPQELKHLGNVRTAARWIELPPDAWSRAEQIAAILHAAGASLRMADLLILTLADALNLQLLHCDRDFDRALKLQRFSRLKV